LIYFIIETRWKGLMVLNLMAAISLLFMRRKTARSRIKCDVIILHVVVVMAVDAAETEVEEMTLVTEATAVEGIATVVVMVVILVITSEVEDGTEAAAVAATEATVVTVAAQTGDAAIVTTETAAEVVAETPETTGIEDIH
jgi:hypothetical protein